MFAPPPSVAERLFPSSYVPLEAGSSVHHVGIADLTGDGTADIIYLGTSYDSYLDGYPNIGSFLGPPRDGVLTRGSLAPFDVGSALAMTVTDLNGDGRADIVAVMEPYYDDAMLWVGLGRAQPGGLEPHAEIQLPGRPISIATGDLDGDGKSDVAVARMYADSVSIFRGTGDGGLVPGPGIAIYSPWSVAVGDLNGDGRLDVVVVDTEGSIYSFLSDGGGGFERHWGVYIGGLLEHIELADVNGDGRLDLLIPGAVMLGDGVGSFAPKLSYAVDGPFAVGDFDADHRPDLAVLSGAGLYILTGRGDGSFTPTADYQVSGSDVAVGDLDQDGNLDLSVAAGAIRNLYGNGDGTFGQEIPSFPVGRFPVAIATGDLNGDRRVDLAVANQLANTVSILMGAPGGTFISRHDLNTGAVPCGVVLEDFDRDGNLDLAVAELGARNVSVFSGHGDGTFGPKVAVPVVTGEPTSLKVGDFDEDGFPDLAVSDGGLSVLVYFGGPGGIGASGRTARVGLARSGQELAVEDITGDGHLDIVIQGDDVGYVPGLGDGTFGPEDWESGPDYGYFYSVATIDLCNNCAHQVLAGSYCCVLTNGGDARYLNRVFSNGCNGSYGGVDDVAGGAMAVGDLNGDGMDDLVTPWTGITVLLGNGRGWFGARQDFGVPVGLPTIVDVNGDGRQDVLVLNTPRDRVLVLLNQGTRTTPPGSPGRVKAVAGDASIALNWAPVVHPELAGYRVHYDARRSSALVGVEASEGPSPIEVPAGRTSLTLHCLPDSAFWMKVTAVDRSGRESECTPLLSARPRPVGGEFSFMGGSLNAASHGRWVMGLVQLDDGLSAAGIVPSTVMVNGVGPVDQLGVTDRDHDGRSELMIRFPRSAVQGGGSSVLVEGRVAGCRDTLRFAVDDSIRVRRPGAQPQTDAEDGREGDRPAITFALHPMAPSPASAGCAIAFDLPEPAVVRLSVFDLRGRLMSTVLEQDMPPGAHSVWWDRRSLPDGVYFAKLEAGRFRAVRTIVLIR